MTALAELIARLEAATEGSRELDAEIGAHPATPSCGVRKGAAKERVVEAADTHDPPLVNLPHYTTSIDAALTLVPEGMEWALSNHGQTGAEQLCWAGVFGSPFIGSECDSHAATPVLALCIAALRAREAQP